MNAFQTMFPHSAWAGQFVAGVAVVSGSGALIAWTSIVTETSRAIAQDETHPFWRAFAWEDKRGTAWSRYRRRHRVAVVAHALALLDEHGVLTVFSGPRGPHGGDRRHPVLLLSDSLVDAPRLQALLRPGLGVGA